MGRRDRGGHQGDAERHEHPEALFEATFGTRSFAGSLHARVDVLNPVGKGAWDLIEVKSTTGTKNVHLPDLAFQRYVAEASGLKIRRCAVLHLSSDHRRAGEVDPRELFCRTSVTTEVRPHLVEVEPNVARPFDALSQSEAPDVAVGPHCDNPYGCPLQERCWSFLPERNVFLLWRGGAKVWDLLGRGITALGDMGGGCGSGWDCHPLPSGGEILVLPRHG